MQPTCWQHSASRSSSSAHKSAIHTTRVSGAHPCPSARARQSATRAGDHGARSWRSCCVRVRPDRTAFRRGRPRVEFEEGPRAAFAGFASLATKQVRRRGEEAGGRRAQIVSAALSLIMTSGVLRCPRSFVCGEDLGSRGRARRAARARVARPRGSGRRWSSRERCWRCARALGLLPGPPPRAGVSVICGSTVCLHSSFAWPWSGRGLRQPSCAAPRRRGRRMQGFRPGRATAGRRRCRGAVFDQMVRRAGQRGAATGAATGRRGLRHLSLRLVLSPGSRIWVSRARR